MSSVEHPKWDSNQVLVKKNTNSPLGAASDLKQNGIFSLQFHDDEDYPDANKASLLTIPESFNMFSSINLNLVNEGFTTLKEGYSNIDVTALDDVTSVASVAGEAADERIILQQVSDSIEAGSDPTGFFPSSLSERLNALNQQSETMSETSDALRAGPLYALDSGVINTARANNFFANYYLDKDANQHHNVNKFRILDFNLDDAQNRRYQLNQQYNQKIRQEEIELYYKKYYQDRKSIISEVLLVIIFLFVLYVLRRNGILNANLFNTFFSLTLFVFIFFRLTRRVIDLYRRDPRYYDEFIFDDPSFALTKPDFGATIPRLGKETYICFINTISEQKTLPDLLDKLLGGNCSPSSDSNTCVKGRDLNNTFLQLITDENYAMFWHNNNLNPKTLVSALKKVKTKLKTTDTVSDERGHIDEIITIVGMMGDIIRDYDSYYTYYEDNSYVEKNEFTFVSNSIKQKLNAYQSSQEEDQETAIEQANSCPGSVVTQPSNPATPSVPDEKNGAIKKTKYNQRLLLAELVRRILNKEEYGDTLDRVNKSDFINENSNMNRDYPLIDALKMTGKSITRNRIRFGRGCYYYMKEEDEGDCSQKMRCFKFKKSFEELSEENERMKKMLASENMEEVHEGSVDNCPHITPITIKELNDHTIVSDYMTEHDNNLYMKTNYSFINFFKDVPDSFLSG